jgi:serine/threonine-protein kinase
MQDDDLTQLSGDQTRLSGTSPVSSTGTGWLSTSGAINHGRFAPGTIVDGRYRIIGLLGRGGMGEVYRADDLRLGQPVALKLLPEALAQDTQRLAQFHNEVRTARLVSHPHVCRVYDIGDLVTPGSSASAASHQIYLSMEFVDGEDLAALLKRVGRLSEDRTLDLARQICAGLAAAHSRGVIHRDLKPANIMLDRDGQVRLMDFGLAAVGHVSDVRAGTPAYMAPEQLAGTGVSVQSDIWALGLVLYELFTGRRAFDVKSLPELLDLQQSAAIVPPTAHVPGLAPAIERVILRCLQPRPGDRPPSAMAVAAALPGGDPLAAALAAGETPSPQMVAAAGDTDASTALRAWPLWICLALACVVGSVMLSSRLGSHAHVPLDRSPSSLFDRARDLEQLGGPRDRAVVDRAWGLAPGLDPLVFWYRSSPDYLVGNQPRPTFDDPPARLAGDTQIVLDLAGRLQRWERFAPTTEPPVSDQALSWQPWLDAAGLVASPVPEVAPIHFPRAAADQRQVWRGHWSHRPESTLRIETGSLRGHPAYFRILGAWDDASTPTRATATTSLWSTILSALIGIGFTVLAVMLGRANIRAGRGDRTGAWRVAATAVTLLVLRWLAQAHHVPDLGLERYRLFSAFGGAIIDGFVLWLFYLAAEPYVRRTWPHILIGWSRLISHGVRDRLIGRDLVVGLTVGLSMTVLSYVYHLVPGWIGAPAFAPHQTTMLFGTRDVIWLLTDKAFNAMGNALLGVLGLAMLRMSLSRLHTRLGGSAPAFVIATLAFTPLAMNGQFVGGLTTADVLFAGVSVLLILGVIFRFGLLAGMIGFTAHFFTWAGAFTTDVSRPYFEPGLTAMAVVVGALVWGAFTLSRRPD